MSTSDSGAILRDAAAPAEHRDDSFDMNVTDDDLINDPILNERWRATGGLNTALLDDYVDPDQPDIPAAAAAAAAGLTAAAGPSAAGPSTTAPLPQRASAGKRAAAPSPNTLPSQEPPLASCAASPPVSDDSAEEGELVIDDDLGAPIGISQQNMRDRIAANTAARPATPGAAGPQVTAFTTWRERALGTSTIPSPLQPDGQPSLIGMSHISAGEGLDECPWPCPINGVKDIGMSFTEIVTAHQEVFGPNGIDRPFLAKLKTEVAKDFQLPGELAVNNQHHPDRNPTGFPNPNDRTLLCRAFLLLRTGEDTGCNRYTRTFQTKNLPRKFKVALGCAFSKCPGYRSMGASVMSQGAPGMLLVSKALISVLVEDMHSHRADAYATRVNRCINILLRHSTLLIGWLRYEAFVASKEEELMRALTPTVGGPPSPGTREARKGKGARRSNKGKGSDRAGRSGRIASTPRARVVPQTPQTPLASTSTVPARTPSTPVASDTSTRGLFLAWAQAERARSRAGRSDRDRDRDRHDDRRSATSRRS